MAHGNREFSDPVRRRTQGSSTTPFLIATGCFAIVLGAIYVASDNSAPAPVADAASLAVASKPIAPSPLPPVAAVNNSPSTTAVVELAPQPAPAETVPVIDPAAERLARVEAQLAAGEFGPALETARKATDAAERTKLLKKIADAQMQIGEFDAALASIRQMPSAEARVAARGERAVEQTLAGGGTGADFTQLIDLIQQETSGPWEEEDGTGGTISEFETGVRVNPNGLLTALTKEEQTGRLNALGLKAREADLNDDMARPSNLRLVSLTRLEQEVARRLAEGKPVVETMQHLAGLSQVTHVFVYPEEREIVIGGPAEGWQYNETGLAVGVSSGRPTLQLDDLVTVLRTFSKDGMGIFGCSINPRPEGLRKLKEFVEKSNARGPLRAGGQVRNWVRQLQEKLGLQDVQLYGIPPESRVARVIVEADYRMKLIGIGKLDGAGIPSFFDLLTEEEQKSATLDALRWWLSMKYDSILHSPNHNVFEIRGSSVLCQSENQFVTAQGERIQTGKAEATNRLFAENFTQRYEELARHDLVFADLQNVFDLALVAALLRHERIADRIGWDLGAFAQNGSFQPAEYEPPRVVESVVNHRVYRGRDIVVQVAGGVRADVMSLVQDDALMKSVERLKNFVQQARAPQLPEGRWWWDAAQ